MAFANADLYAPDDAARDASGNMIRTGQDVYHVIPEHATGAAVGAATNPLVALGVLALVAWLWARFHRG